MLRAVRGVRSIQALPEPYPKTRNPKDPNNPNNTLNIGPKTTEKKSVSPGEHSFAETSLRGTGTLGFPMGKFAHRARW